jgi:hypothetical protein
MRKLTSGLLVTVSILTTLTVAGCNGGSPTASAVGKGGDSTGSSGGNTTVLVNLGDFAYFPDQIVSLQLTVESLKLHSSQGDVSLLSAPRRFELSRLKAEPLLLGNVAQGNYSGVVIGVSNPEISYIDSNGQLHQGVAASLTSSTATNNSEFSIGSTPVQINLHLLLLGASFGGSVTMTPGLNLKTGGSFWGTWGNTWGYPIEDLVGRVTAVDGSSFTIDVGNGASTFATDSNTKFQGVTGLYGLAAGMTLDVDAMFGPDGIFRSTKVALENNNAGKAVVEGLTLSLAPAQLQMMVREVHGPGGVTLPDTGKALTVGTSASTLFRLEPGNVDLNNLDFTPTFDALTISPGQNVRAAADGGSATTITANQLKLAKQSLDGTAGSVTTSSVSGQYSFSLSLSPNSAFAQLTGHTSVLVTLQPSTQMALSFGYEDCVTCIAGGTVRVRGLLFFSGGQYRLVADRLLVTG